MRHRIGRLLCWLGLHKWECDTSSEYYGDGTYLVRDHNRCKRLGCPRYAMWHVMNVERRRVF